MVKKYGDVEWVNPAWTAIARGGRFYDDGWYSVKLFFGDY